MSKLFKLKEYLKLPDAAAYLSKILKDEVTEADILHLALNEKLKLSIDIVNHARAKRGKVVSWMETEWEISNLENISSIMEMKEQNNDTKFEFQALEDPPKLLEIRLDISESGKDTIVPFMSSINIDNERFINLENEVSVISGIWDLPMIGGEKLDIKHRFEQLTGGPAVTIDSFYGTFVEGENGVIWQLQENLEEDETKSRAIVVAQQILSEQIKLKEITTMEAVNIFNNTYAQEKEKEKEKQYYPKDGLPDDCALVIRTSSLQNFLQTIMQVDEQKIIEPLEDFEREALSKLVIGMAIHGYTYSPSAKKNTAIKDIMTDLEKLGISMGADSIRKYLNQCYDQVQHLISKE